MAAKKAKSPAKAAKARPTPRRTRSSAAPARPRARSLKLHRSIYSTRAVSETIEAFAELATVTLKRQGDYHLLRLLPLEDVPAEPLVHEFANYALSRAARSR
ncbi:MAG: HxsD-like protein [bacterium]